MFLLPSENVPAKNVKIDIIKNITSNVLPISTDNPAIPLAPNKIAIKARQKKVTAALIIRRLTLYFIFLSLEYCYCTINAKIYWIERDQGTSRAQLDEEKLIDGGENEQLREKMLQIKILRQIVEYVDSRRCNFHKVKNVRPWQ